MTRSQQELEKFDELLDKARVKGTVALIVGLPFELKPEGSLRPSSRTIQRAQIAQRQDELLRRLEAFSPENVIQFQTIPYVAMTVDAATVEFLKTLPEVRNVSEDELRRPNLADSTDIVDAPESWNEGYSGKGQIIAILDTGVEKTHPFLSGKVVAEACFSANDPQRGGTSLCPGGARQSTAPDSALPCTLGEDKDCGHGTHVAGIAAGRLPTGDRQGVAKDANLVAIQVFLRMDTPGEDGCDDDAPPCVRTADKDVLRGLEHVLLLKQRRMDIAAANLSLGDKPQTRNCDDDFPSYRDLINHLHDEGVATVVSSGNGSRTNALNVPACISKAVSVGSTGDGSEGVARDAVAGTSNSADFLSLLAPGQWINSSSLNGSYQSRPGTSMAAPHVAGAWAVLKQRAPNASVTEVLDALRNTGDLITDTRNNVVKRRINVDKAMRAIQSCSYSLSPTNLSVAAASGGSFNVTAPPGCAWTAASNAGWLTTSSSGSGTGTASFTVAANTGLARVASINVGGQSLTVNQAGTLNSVAQLKLAATDHSAGDLLGHSVAISGDTAVVGAPGDDVGANTDQGSAYVFVRNAAGAWAQQAKLVATGGVAGDEFGWSVALDGNTMVVGARSRDIGARANQGAAYVFVRSGTVWMQQTELVAPADTPEAVVEDHFGESVAIHGNRVVVGSPGFETSGLSGLIHRGAAYIFHRSGATWTRQDTRVQGLMFAKIGRSVATRDFTVQGVSVSVIAVGAPAESRGAILGDPVLHIGSVHFHVLDPPSGLWFDEQRFIPIDGGDGDEFGDSLAMGADGTIIVGARSTDINSMTDRGAAYVLTPAGGAGGVRWSLQTRLTADDGAPGDHFGGSVGISGNAVIVGARHADVNANQNQGAAYVFGRAGAIWTQQHKLLANDGSASDELSTGVGISDGAAITGAASREGRRGASYIFGPLAQPSSGCSYSLSPTGAGFAALGGDGSINVSALAGCAWSATSTAPWITFSAGASGSGDGRVSINVSPNAGTARTATLTVAGSTFTVTQAAGGGCGATLYPSSQPFGAPGGAGQTTVITNGWCGWAAASNADWLTVNVVSTSTGTGRVSYTAAPNNGPATRAGTLTIAGVTYIVTQAAAGTSPVVQFGAAAFTTAENTQSRSASVMVTRQGDTAGSVTVEYATVDNPAAVPCNPQQTPERGTAYARCDYATTVDTLTFAPGETVKSFSVPLTDDTHAEGNETFQLVLRNPAGASLGALTAATVTILDDEAGNASSNPIVSTPFFVRQQYLDFLNREPEAGEPWSNVLNNCSDVNDNPACDRATVSGAFFGSPEFRLKGLFVFLFYKISFGTPANPDYVPGYDQIIPDMRRVTGATGDEVIAKRLDFTEDWVRRAPFVARYNGTTDAQYVDTLLANVGATLFTPDPISGVTRASLIEDLAAGRKSRADVLRAIVETQEVSGLQFNRAFVAMQYYAYLRRTPEAGGYQAWLRVINQDPSNIRTMIRGFINSQEYALRFGQP